MADEPDVTPIQSAWLKFTDSTRVMLVPQPEDRPFDQFLAFRDRVYVLVQGKVFLDHLQSAWAPLSDSPLMEVGDLLLMELEAFPRAVEVANTTASSEPEKKGWMKGLLGRASTVAGSVDDLVANLPPLAKGGIILFRELVDLAKGKD